MGGFSATVQNALNIVQIAGLALVGLFIAVVGLMFVFGSEKMRAKAKEHLMGIIIGGILLSAPTAIATIIKGIAAF